MSRILSLPIVRFGLVGLTNFVVSFSSFHALLHLFAGTTVRATLAQFGSYAIGIGWSYFWNQRWTFRSSEGRSEGADAPAERPMAQFLRFATLQVSLMVASSVSLGVLVDRMHQPATLMWFAVMCVNTTLNYLLSRYWAFRPVESTASARPSVR